MNEAMVMNLAYEGMKVAVTVAGPPLFTLLAVGLLISLFQAATQINEMTMSFIPKVIATLVVIVLFGPMFIRTLVDFTRNLILNIPNVIG
jgi:flagellar biosynthetic protein FliQ